EQAAMCERLHELAEELQKGSPQNSPASARRTRPARGPAPRPTSGRRSRSARRPPERPSAAVRLGR
ncbi:Rop family plasmid primer RNA-binding protein, partial [Escherichia coli]|nr:Rop family plasmid primer RNA-binding protein [Escherichia coli]